MKLLVALALLPLAHGQGMGNGISKNTYSVTEASEAYDWIATYLPIGCFDGMCTGYNGCAHLGRSQLCTSTSDCDASMSSGAKLSWADRFAAFAPATPAAPAAGARTLLQGPPPPGDDDHSGPPGPSSSGGMGIHCVNSTARPYLDELSTPMVEQYFNEKVGDHSAYDAFMDFSLVLFSNDLQTYVSKFDAAGEAYLPVQWAGESGSAYYSILKQVPNTQVIFEIMSSSKPTTSRAWLQDDLVRVPDAAMTDNAASATPTGILTPVAVSKGCSNLTAVADYYEGVLQATKSLSSASANATLAAFKLTGAAVQIRFVERPAAATAGSFTVAEWETKKLNSYKAFSTDPACGFSKWYDNHFAWDQTTISMETFVAGLDAGGWAYHNWNSPNNNIYCADPTGDTIQLDANWNNCNSDPWCSIAEGDALADNCMMGNCEQASTSACASQVAALCSSSDTETCMDCVHNNWETITAQLGCTIADAAYHCTGYR